MSVSRPHINLFCWVVRGSSTKSNCAPTGALATALMRSALLRRVMRAEILIERHCCVAMR